MPIASAIKGLPACDACGAATADSRSARSRMPGRPPCAAITSACIAATAAASRRMNWRARLGRATASRPLGQTLKQRRIAANQGLGRRGRILFGQCRPHGRDDDGTAFMHGDVHAVAGLEPGELAQRCIEDEPLRIAYLADGLQHERRRKTMFDLCYHRAGRTSSVEFTADRMNSALRTP